MSRLITVHNTADEPIYDIVIKNSFEDMKDEFVRLKVVKRKQ